jgi:hypothetical protein
VHHRISSKVGDDKEIDVAPWEGGAFSVGTEEYDLLGSKRPDKPLDRNAQEAGCVDQIARQVA